MDGPTFLSVCVQIAISLLCISLLLAVGRVVKGPTLPDRVMALDMLVVIAIGFIVLLGVRSGYGYHLDIAIGLGLVGFFSTVALARFVLSKKNVDIGAVESEPDA